MGDVEEFTNEEDIPPAVEGVNLLAYTARAPCIPALDGADSNIELS